MADPLCWVITEGYPGNENQALGLAEALGLTPEVKRIRARSPWTHLPPRLWPGALGLLDRRGDTLEPPWPGLVISAGKRAAAPAAAIRRRAAEGDGRCFAVHVQQPPVSARKFDLVVVPQHDSLRGGNVLVTQAALHRVTDERLKDAARRLGPRLEHLPRPRIAVLIGGSNRRYRLTEEITRDLAARLAHLAESDGAGLMVTASRRTGGANEAILRAALAGLPADLWDGSGDNPYFAYLALADHIVVTCDSVSMASEACATGKPVHVVDLAGSSRRIGAFHDSLRAAGLTRRFTGALEDWSYRPPDDTARVAAEIRQRMG